LRRHPVTAVATTVLLVVVAVSASAPILVRAVVLLVSTMVLGGTVWRRVLDASDRAAVFGLFRRPPAMKEATR
jgi:hypothetical protein